LIVFGKMPGLISMGTASLAGLVVVIVHVLLAVNTLAGSFFTLGVGSLTTT